MSISPTSSSLLAGDRKRRTQTRSGPCFLANRHHSRQADEGLRISDHVPVDMRCLAGGRQLAVAHLSHAAGSVCSVFLFRFAGSWVSSSSGVPNKTRFGEHGAAGSGLSGVLLAVANILGQEERKVNWGREGGHAMLTGLVSRTFLFFLFFFLFFFF